MTVTKTRFATVLLASTMLAPSVALADGSLTRLATVPLGAEVTGLFITPSGDLFFNGQHPDDTNVEPYNRATVGVLTGVNMNELPASFDAVPVPDSQEAKQSFQTALGEYQILVQEGDHQDLVPGGLGAMTTSWGKEILQSNDPDFNAYVPTNEPGTEGYLFTNWEDRPGGMSRIKLMKGDDGKWQVDASDVQMVDFRPVNGTWVNCFGSLSPWGTPLTSEELYFDDTKDWNNPNFDDYDDQESLAQYLGRWPNPYDYGYIVELTDPAGEVTPVKRFSMGRFSHENSVVMPDDKTVYMSDDGTGVVFFKFVADTAGDLSSGTLYAAKVTQDEGTDAAKTGFDVEWVELAHGDDATVESWVREYDGITPLDFVEGENSYISDDDVQAWANGEGEDDRAAFLESRKAAAAKGATAEFRKMEGVMINYEAAADGSVPMMYMAMSEVNETMADQEGDIQLDEHFCGVVYGMQLDDAYNVTRMEPALAGGTYDEGAEVNGCPTDQVANPDNLLVLKDGRVVVGEDTGDHENNMLWVFDPSA